jgi:hypothetical protein
MMHNSIYNQHLRPAMSTLELFRVFALSNEFKLLPVCLLLYNTKISLYLNVSLGFSSQILSRLHLARRCHGFIQEVSSFGVE